MLKSVDPQRLRLTSSDGSTGVLLGAECLDCGVKVFGPATFCQSCTSANLREVEFGSKGNLFSYTIVRVPPAGWPGPVPYILGEIELAEGPHVLSEVVDAVASDLAIGREMELAFQNVAINSKAPEELVVYKWRPAVVSSAKRSTT